MNAEEIARKLGKASKSAKGWWNCLCPLHKEDSPSFGLKDNDNGKNPSFKCHRGCSYFELKAELERLGYFKKTEYKKKAAATIEASYEYRDENDFLLFESVKLRKENGKKAFFQRHRDPKTGEWVKGIEGVRRVLFHLPQLVQHIKDGTAILLVEGEKDVLTAEMHGLAATTNPMGALKWADEYSEIFRGCSNAIYIVPDNDKTGSDHAREVAESLTKVGIKPRIAQLPNLPEKGDLTDWFNEQHTFDELIDVLADAPEWENQEISFSPPVSDEEVIAEIEEEESLDSEAQGDYQKGLKAIGLGRYPDGDIANGKRLLKRHGPSIRFIEEVGFSVFNGQIWPLAKKCAPVYELAKETIDSIQEEVKVVQPYSPALAKKLRVWEKKCATNSGYVNSMLQMASTEEEIRVPLKDFDSNPKYLNCLNGVLNLETLELYKHDPKFLCTKQTNANWNEEADCPKFLKVLKRSVKSDEVIAYMWRVFGLCLLGEIPEQKIWMFLGPGGTGKSLITNRIFKLMGSYAKSVRKQMFMQKNGAESQTDNLGQLQGIRFCVVSEISRKDTFDENVIKDLSGDDPVTGRMLFSEPFNFMPQCKIFFRSNHKPKVDGSDTGIQRRLHILPFREKVEESDQDKTLAKQIDSEELDGILYLCALGLHDYWNNGGLRTPKEVLAETTEYHQEMDTFGTFIREYCNDTNVQAETSGKVLREAYEKWCKRTGRHPMNDTNFGIEMKQRGFAKKHTMYGNTYLGISLKPEALYDHSEDEETEV